MTSALAAAACLGIATAQTAGTTTQASASCDRVVYEMLRGHYTRALRQLDGAPTPGRSEAERTNLRGLATMMSGDARKAIESFETALELQPSLGEARLNLAVARMQLGEYARASEQLDRLWADAKSPLRARAAYHNALANESMGRTDAAVQWIERAIESDPGLADALLYSGFLYERKGDLQKAGRAYKAYLDRRPDSVVAMLRFGISAQRSGFAETGRKYLARVVEAAPDSPMAAEARKFLVMWE